MSDPNNVVKIDLGTLTEFQSALHLHDDHNREEEIDSRFSCEFKKTSWSTSILVQLNSRDEGEWIVYEASPKFNYLLYTCIRQRLLALKVREEYKGLVQICWPHNTMLNYNKLGLLCFDDDVAQTVDDIWFNIYYQHYMDGGAGKRDHFNLMIGNINYLQEWTDHLPECVCLLPQIWYYCKNEALAIPLFMCSLSKVTHKYKFRNNLNEFLRMRARTDHEAEWEEIPFDSSLIEGCPSDNKLPCPELWGRYAQVTDSEINWRKEDNKINTIYIDDIGRWSSEDYKSYGSPITIDLHFENPCKAIFWVAENLEATANRNYSNFTTNSNDIASGWNPFASGKLLYGSVERIPELDSDFFDRMEPWYRFPSAPCEPGYNSHSFAYKTGELGSDISIVFESSKLKLNAKLVLKLGNTDPFLKQIRNKQVDDINKSYSIIADKIRKKKESKDDNNEPKFKVHARFLLMKKIKFTNDRCNIITAKSEQSQSSKLLL